MKVKTVVAPLTWPVTDVSHASGDRYAASWFQRWEVVHTPSGSKAKSDPSRPRMKSRAMPRASAGMLRSGWSVVRGSAIDSPRGQGAP